jgi:hypothetical protein
MHKTAPKVFGIGSRDCYASNQIGSDGGLPNRWKLRQVDISVRLPRERFLLRPWRLPAARARAQTPSSWQVSAPQVA